MNKETSLNHVETIRRLLNTMRASEKMHALLIFGSAGWGKSTTVDEALRLSGADACTLGSYSTPLNLFNFLHEHANQIVLIDDSSGIYSEPSSMALLKAATWAQGRPRVLQWGSTTGKASTEEFEFFGKLVIVGNSFPNTSDAEAVKSRAFHYQIEISVEKAKLLLLNAANNVKWYRKTKQANRVSEFLCRALNTGNLPQISYRTLQMGYELAEHNPDDWEMLLSQMISIGTEDPKKLVQNFTADRFNFGIVTT